MTKLKDVIPLTPNRIYLEYLKNVTNVNFIPKYLKICSMNSLNLGQIFIFNERFPFCEIGFL